MNRIVTLQERVEDYLAERRRLGYRLRTTAGALRSFARDVDRLELTGPLTIDVMSVWARQAKTHSDDLTIWARRLRLLGPFTTWLQQFEPATEVPDSTVFGRIGWRLAPHIFTEQEIIDLLTAARRLEPDLRGATYQALFGVLFLDFASQRLGKAPTALSLTDIVPDLILAFLDHLEQERHNTAQTRNLRLVALRAFLTFAARRDVTALQSIEQALGVPLKRFEQPMLGFLTREEMLAVIGEADETWTSQRDHLLLTVLYNTGARVSEMIGVQVGDVVLDASPCVHLHGKGRKRRSVPLWTGTVQAVRAWVRRNPLTGEHGAPAAQPQRTGDDTLQCQQAPGDRGCTCRRALSQSQHAAHLASLREALYRHAYAAVRRRLQRDRALAGAREHDDHAPLRRGRSDDEAKRSGSPSGARDGTDTLPAARRADALPSGPVIM